MHLTAPLLLALAGSVPPNDPASSAPQEAAPLARSLDEPVPGQPYERYWTEDELGRRIDFHLSEVRAEEALPLVLYVQGSSAESHFVRHGEQTRGRHGHSAIEAALRGHAHLLLVEKPGVPYLDDGREPSAAFRREHTLERWCTALRAALGAARSLPFVDRERTLVVGHSEGGLVASRLAAELSFVTHVATLAGGGGSQLFDLLLLARRGAFFGHVSDDPEQRERYLLERWGEIQREPESAERLWFGHSFRRWSSFLAHSPAEELARTDARIFIAQGAADRAVATESFQFLHTELLARGRDVTARLIPGADHSFAWEEDGVRVDGWSEIHHEIRDWFLAP